MAHKHGELSEQMYHKIYRLLQREKDPHILANALKLPLRTVQNVIDRINQDEHNQSAPAGHVAHSHKTGHHGTEAPERVRHDERPMVFLSSKIRFAVVDVGGHLTGQNIAGAVEELRAALAHDFKAFAIRLAEVASTDEAAMKTLAAVAVSSNTHGRYVAFLDPSPQADAALARLDAAGQVPVFGTERAFEESAFKVEIEFTKKKAKALRP